MLEKHDPKLSELFAIWPRLPYWDKWRVTLFGVYLVIRKRVKSLWVK